MRFVFSAKSGYLILVRSVGGCLGPYYRGIRAMYFAETLLSVARAVIAIYSKYIDHCLSERYQYRLSATEGQLRLATLYGNVLYSLLPTLS